MIKNENIKISAATIEDVKELSKVRVAFLRELGKFADENFLNMTADYFRRNIGGSLIANVAKCNDKIIATVILCVYECIPTTSNITGNSARIFSVYTDPKYRGEGISSRLLEKTIEDAQNNGITDISLKAEIKALPLYKKLGFAISDREMVLVLDS